MNKNRKNNKKNDVSCIFRNFFVTVFAILLICVLICAVSISSDETQYQLTGEKHERISYSDIAAFF
ncbi:MAG: hypothetical protein E7573_05430 [Ruminococcaceae bacterium]|nr:hypothetical protein [Oscillospiraceae bacterium]MBR3597922.1 hypothetical protein [Clostridia bacterium]